MIYCVSEGTTDILKEREDEGYYSTLIGRYLMDSEVKIREFFRVSRDIFHLILTEIKDITTRSWYRWQTSISAEQKFSLTLRYVGKQATIINIILLIILIQPVTTITQKCKYTNHLNWTHQQSWKYRGQIRHLYCFSFLFHSEEVLALVLVLRRHVATWISCWAWGGQHLSRWLAGCWGNITLTGITGHLITNWRRRKIVKRKTRSSRLVLLM